MLTAADYFAQHQTEPSPEVRANADALLCRVNALLAHVAVEAAARPRINSGWRPEYYNNMVPGAAIGSRHITGEAVDLADPGGELDDYLMHNEWMLASFDLYMEHPSATKNWCHLQSAPPKSGRRVFYP